MAGDSDTEMTDMPAHVQTYSSVIALFKWGGLTAIAVALLVIWLIS